MPVIIRGRRVMFLQSQPGDGPQPVKRPPCEYCGKPQHAFSSTWGSHIGNSTLLADAILAGREANEHPWYTGSRTIAAHHLICSQAMADDEDWARFCREFGYDINGKANGVFLPMVMAVACELEVPVHSGPHTSGWAFDMDMAYPDAVKNLLSDIADVVADGGFCAEPAALKRELDALSAEILRKVASFTWTISADGLDYKPGGLGCAGATSITAKPRRACPRNRRHGSRQSSTGQALAQRALQVGA